MGVPLSTGASRRRGHREEQDRLNAVQGIVREQRTMVARAGREHLIPLRQHVDRAGGIGHDLLCEPVLEGRDHPIIAIVDDQDLTRSEFLVSSSSSTPSAERSPASEPGTGYGLPGRRDRDVHGDRRHPSRIPSLLRQQREFRPPGSEEPLLAPGHSDPSFPDSLGADFASGARKSGSPCGMPQPVSPEQAGTTWQAGSILT